MYRCLWFSGSARWFWWRKLTGRTALEATEQVVVRLEQNLPPDMRKVYPFDLGSAQLKAEFHPALLRLAEVLRANPSLKLFVIGYADQTGDPAFNHRLSIQRAEGVKKFLVESCGIEAFRIEVQGKGRTIPSPTMIRISSAFNRRVEFVLFPTFASLQVVTEDVQGNWDAAC